MSEPITPEKAIEVLGHTGQMRTVYGRMIADVIRTLAARNAELEEAARWRSCKDEPPVESGAYIVRQHIDGQPWTDLFTNGAWNNQCPPLQWRPLP